MRRFSFIGVFCACLLILNIINAKSASAVAASATLSFDSLVSSVSKTVVFGSEAAKGSAFNLRYDISVRNASKYAIFISSNNETTALVNSASSDKIASISSPLKWSDFPRNTWGYKMVEDSEYIATVNNSNTLYEQIAPLSNPSRAISKDLANTSDRFEDIARTYVAAFPYVVDRNIEDGLYTGTQVVSLVAEDRPTILTDIDYMQDMTPEICTDTPTPSNTETYSVFTRQLIDKRDNKKYWVAKLADGHCWMTQNLALDLDTSKTLTPDDTDISTNWTPASSTTNVANTGDTSFTSIQSWSWGDYVINSPNAGANLCSGRASNLQSCSGIASMTNVGTGTGYTDDFVSTGTDANIVAVDTVNKKYDAHYLLGNYYTWNAATAGTGGTITNTNATSSICPKGWHLPTSNNTDPGSFAHLLNTTYGKTTGLQISQAPFYFHLSGYVWPISGGGMDGIGYVGYFGRHWSSTASFNANDSDYLYFSSNRLNLSLRSFRVSGYPARCII